MKILGFDIETTGLDTTKNRIVEMAAIRYDSEHKNFSEFYSTLCWSDGHSLEPWTTEKWHGLPRDLVRDCNVTMTEAIIRIQAMMMKADAICGQNILNFDLPFFESECRKIGMHDSFNTIRKGKIIIDTSTDLPFGDNISSRRLNHLLVDHGMWNPEKHKALFDVYYTLKLLQCYPLEQVLERSKSQTIKVAVSIPREQNAVVKSRRYQWNPQTRMWWKVIKDCDFQAECDAIGVEPLILETL